MELIEISIKLIQEFYPEIAAVIFIIITSVLRIRLRKVKAVLVEIELILQSCNHALADDQLTAEEIRKIVERVLGLII